MSADRVIGDAYFDLYVGDVWVTNSSSSESVKLCENPEEAFKIAKMLTRWAKEHLKDNPAPTPAKADEGVVCAMCSGSGLVRQGDVSRRGEYMVSCSDCRGTGKRGAP